MTNQTALILGANGQDGALICRSLLGKGYKVIGLCRTEANSSKNLIQLGIEQDIKIKKGDISNFNTISKLLEKYQPDEIYNLAGQSSVGKSFTAPIKTTQSIIDGTVNILEVCKILNYTGKMFFAGSSEMFGHTEQAADINHKQEPQSPYAISKQASFGLVKMYREMYSLKCVTGILFNHESPLRSKDFVTQKIIEGAIIADKYKTKIQLGNIKISRDWGWAEEYVEAMQLITQSKMNNDHVICTGKLTSLEEFLKIAYKKFDLNWQDHVDTDDCLKRKSEIEKSFGDPNPLYKEQKWRARINLESIIESLIEYKLQESQELKS